MKNLKALAIVFAATALLWLLIFLIVFVRNHISHLAGDILGSLIALPILTFIIIDDIRFIKEIWRGDLCPPGFRNRN